VTSLQSLCPKDFSDPQVLLASPPPSALSDLELQKMHDIKELPPLNSLSAMQTLELVNFVNLRQLPLLKSLSAQQVDSCTGSFEVALPFTLTALPTLTLKLCPYLHSSPP
jgi:hypothetical protein